MDTFSTATGRSIKSVLLPKSVILKCPTCLRTSPYVSTKKMHFSIKHERVEFSQLADNLKMELLSEALNLKRLKGRTIQEEIVKNDAQINCLVAKQQQVKVTK